MKPLIIYHVNCADGFGAAFAAWLKFGDEAEYVAVQYGKPLPEQLYSPVGLELYILDFSFNKEQMDTFFQYAKRVVWLDHHKTAFEMWCEDGEMIQFESGSRDVGAHYILLDNNKSGAMLAWEYFHPGAEVPMLIKHIDDHDRWQFKIEGTKEFNKALWSYAPWSFEQWANGFLPCNDLGVENNFGTMMYASRLDEGAAILRAHDANVQAVVKGAGRKCLLNLPNVLGFEPNGLTLYGIAANCPPHLASDVGHALANQSGTYGLLWYLNKDNKCLCSLRSNGDYDVSAIAKAFGGGGHKNAAGFEVAISTLLDWIK